MAEVILPPEESEPELPEESEPELPEEQLPEVDKPTELSKVITVKFNPLDTGMTSTANTRQSFYTTDTDAWVVFEIENMDAPNGEYSLVLYNKSDGSIFQRTGDIVSGAAYYKIEEEEIKHAGDWIGQVVITLVNGKTTTSRFSFNVAGHLLDGKDVRQIVIQDFETLMKQLEDLKNSADIDINVLKSNIEEAQRLAKESEIARQETFEVNESERIAAEDERKQSELQREETYDSKVEAAIVEADVVTKVDDKVAELSPTIQNVTAQLAQTEQELNARVSETIANAGDGTLPTEVVDMRTVGDKTYTVAGDALRALADGKAIQKRAIAPDNTTFIRESSNLYNPHHDTVGFVIAGDGAKTPNASYAYTEVFDVIPGATAHYAGFIHAVLRNKDGVFVRRTDLIAPIGTPSSLVVPDGVYGIQWTYMLTQQFKNKQFNFGDALLPYEPYYTELVDVDVADGSITEEKIDDYAVGENKLKPQSVTSDKIKNRGVTKEKVDFIVEGSNLYNPNKDVIGKVIDAYGVSSSNSGYNHTGHFAVLPGEKINQVGFVHYMEYGLGGKFLRRRNIFPEGSSFIASSDCYIIVFNYQISSIYKNRQVNNGDKLLPYEPFEEVLEGVGLSNKAVDKIATKLDIGKLFSVNDRPMIDVPINEIYKELNEYPEITDFGGNVKSADVYQLFDNLVALYPDYLKVIKTAVDDFGNDIKAYSAIPHKPDANVDTKYPKIFITTGTHGYEHPPAMYLYLLMKAMCENWESDSTLEVFRWNVEWIFIPVVNPSGWDDFKRKTRNGIDLNRNFPEGFVAGTDPTATTYAGTEPLSEPESQFVKSVFDDHPDIDVMYDFHNFSGTEATDFFIWIPTSQGASVQHMSQMLVSRLTRKWRKEYDWIPKDESWFAGYTDSTSGGMIADYARSQGINYSATFEVAGRWWLTNDRPYSVLHKQTGMEAFVNWLQINLLEITK